MGLAGARKHVLKLRTWHLRSKRLPTNAHGKRHYMTNGCATVTISKQFFSACRHLGNRSGTGIKLVRLGDGMTSERVGEPWRRPTHPRVQTRPFGARGQRPRLDHCDRWRSSREESAHGSRNFWTMAESALLDCCLNASAVALLPVASQSHYLLMPMLFLVDQKFSEPSHTSPRGCASLLQNRLCPGRIWTIRLQSMMGRTETAALDLWGMGSYVSCP